MTADVSVVIPTRDRWALLRRALRCALGQEGVAVEVVVVDDGSSDGTPDRLAGLREGRLRWLAHEQPRGVAHARNRGVDQARAAWVAFLDDDDLWAPDHLRRLLDALPAGASFAFARHYVVDLEGRVLSRGPDPGPEGLLQQILARNPVVTPSAVLARRDAVHQVGGFDPRFSISADWDLWVRLAALGAVGVSRALTVGYTAHARSMKRDTDRVLREHRALAEKHAALLRRQRMGLGDELFWQWVMASRAHARQRRLAAKRYVRHQIRYARPWTVALGLLRLARAPLLEDGLQLSAEEPSPPWLASAAASDLAAPDPLLRPNWRTAQ